MIDTEDEISCAVYSAFAVFAAGLADGKFVSAEGVLGAKIARTDAIRAAEHLWRFLGSEGRDFAAMFQGLVCFAERDADIAGQGVVAGQTFVGAFENDHATLAAQRIDNGGLGEWADDIDMDGTDLGIALFAEVIASGFDVFAGAAERDEDGIGVVSFVLRDQAIM